MPAMMVLPTVGARASQRTPHSTLEYRAKAPAQLRGDVCTQRPEAGLSSSVQAPLVDPEAGLACPECSPARIAQSPAGLHASCTREVFWLTLALLVLGIFF